MAANWWEEGLNMQVWVFRGRCSSCGGTAKYKYSRTDRPGMELQILPNRKLFRVVQQGLVVATGALTEMKTKIDTL